MGLIKLSKKSRTNTEINNDKLIIWQYLTGPLFYIGGVIIIIVIVACLIIIPDKIHNKIDAGNETKSQQTMQLNVDSFVKNNSDYFGTINKSYWNGSVYNIESSKGKFIINTVNDKVFNVEAINKLNQSVEVYRAK